MSASCSARHLFLQPCRAHLSSMRALTATASPRTTCATSSTTVETTPTKTPTSAVRPCGITVERRLLDHEITWMFFCRCQTEGFSGRCNFEFDMCSWRQDRRDDFDWLIKAGSTLTVGTGPSGDHTLRNSSGHYIYLESSFPQAVGDTACISGPLLSRRSSQCKVR